MRRKLMVALAMLVLAVFFLGVGPGLPGEAAPETSPEAWARLTAPYARFSIVRQIERCGTETVADDMEVILIYDPDDLAAGPVALDVRILSGGVPLFFFERESGEWVCRWQHPALADLKKKSAI